MLLIMNDTFEILTYSLKKVYLKNINNVKKISIYFELCFFCKIIIYFKIKIIFYKMNKNFHSIFTNFSI